MSWLAGYSVFSGTREEEWDADWKMSLYDDDAPELHYRRGGTRMSGNEQLELKATDIRTGLGKQEKKH
jgi:hypothetical protein